MAQTQMIKQKLTVKRVMPKAQSKYGKASIIVTVNGEDEFLGLNDGVDEVAFENGATYDLEISISKSGKRYVNGILGSVKAETPVPKAKATPSKTIDAEIVPGLDRDARITLMNIGNVASNLATGDMDNFEKAFRIVKKVYEAEGL